MNKENYLSQDTHQENNSERLNPLESVPKYLSQFGYDETNLPLAERVHKIAAKGETQLVENVKDIFGDLTVAYLYNAKNSRDVERIGQVLHGGWGSGNLNKLIKLSIIMDYVTELPEDIQRRYRPRYLFMEPLSEFNSHSFADLLRVAKDEDLAAVHKTFSDVIMSVEENTFYTRIYDEEKYPLFKKYFPQKEGKEVEKTYSGNLEFYSETGTEGGYWAFQDECFTGLPNDTEICEKCHYYRSYVENSQSDTPIIATRSIPLSEALEGKKNSMCPPEEHEWNLAYPGGTASYEGLHVLEDGDELTIYDPENPEEIVWDGKISLIEYEIYRENSLGMLTSFVKDVPEMAESATWAQWFFDEYPAKLKTMVTIYDDTD